MKRKICIRSLLGVLLLAISAMVPAAEFRDIMVEREDGLYSMRSEVYFDVEREYLYRVLTDFDLFKKFTGAIVESNNVEPDEHGRPRFYARMEGCVLIWCKSFVFFWNALMALSSTPHRFCHIIGDTLQNGELMVEPLEC